MEPRPYQEYGYEMMNYMHIRSRKTINHNSTDYALKELYFITICVFQRNCLLGQILDYSIGQTALGDAVEATINFINKRNEAATITDYIIMPNHIHMIIDLSRSIDTNVEKAYSIADIIRDFKSFTTRELNKPCSETLMPLWQRGYYDHRIRNDEELKKIKDYIKENPKRWAIDKFYIV